LPESRPRPLRLPARIPSRALLLLLAAAACGRKERGPHLELEANFHDFGTLAAGDTGLHTYRGWNTGTAELVVKAVKASCGCARPELVAIGADGSVRRGMPERVGDVLRLAAGETLELRLSLDARAGAAAGVPEILGNLLLETNEPGRPFLRLEFHVRFDVPVNVLPPQVDVESLGRNETVAREVLLVPTLGRALRISPPAELPPGVRAELASEERGGGGAAPQRVYRLTVTLGPGLPEGFFSTSLFLPTDYREGHRLELPLRARVVGDVLVHPASFEFGVVRRGKGDAPAEGIGRRVALRYTPSARTIRLGEPRVEGEESAHLRASLREVEPGRRFEVVLEAQQGIAAPVFKGFVAIPTDDPENPEVKIPYRGLAREG
jgi:hypothetical protein